MSKNNMKKSAAVIFILSVLSKLFGIVRETVMFYYYGTGAINGAYIVASGIPNILFGIIAGGLISTFIPIYSRVLEKEGKDRATRFMNNTLTMIFFITVIFLIFGLIFTEELVHLSAKGFEGDVFDLTVKFTRVTLYALLTNGVYSIFTGYHQYEGRFYAAPVSGFFLNFIVIGSIFVSAKTDPIVLVYGIVGGSLLQLLFSLFVAMFSGKYKYKVVFDVKDQYIKPMIIMAMPIIFGSSISQINNLIDRTIASSISMESVTVVNNASKISGAVFNLFVTSLTTVMYPTVIRQANRKEFGDLKNTITEIMNIISIIVLPATIGVIVLSGPIVSMFFNIDGNSLPHDLLNIQYALIGATVGLFAMSIKDVLIRVFYSLNDSLTPVIASAIAVVINISLNLALAPVLGAPGLTLATSISALVSMVILYLILNKRLQGLHTRRLIKTVIKISIASVLMGIVVFAVDLLGSKVFSNTLSIIVSVSAGGLVYLAAIYALKVPEFFDVLNMVKVKLKIGNK